ncbi:hypothetical protein IEO21_03532 [Rhodonia placenta]|uniref:Ankyrin n=1 Tax=Rhodonia placenta TaxID=104341 RepID=A0A8H7U3T6_9APHY|nr:hypothetical protein IEO21_03532 [Postia placenta]
MSQTPEAVAFLSRVAQLPKGPGAFDALSDVLQASIDDEAALRKLFATDKTNPRLNDPHVGLVDVFDAPTDIRTTRARVVKSESDVAAKFILPLSEDRRRQEGMAAMVQTFDEFKQNWTLFTEGSLSQLTDWNNVIAAGGAVQACLSPVPASAKVSKRALRKHFHNTAYPTSDVDLFLYGMTTEEAEKKIQAIYEAVRDSVPWDVTCVRSRHTVSIHSQYPYRAVQIVLRLYRSPAEILAGFDVDAPCCAYDGRRVWANPRAIVAMMRQCNTVDMTRRSPSYEVRLAKYSSRDFEVYVPTLRRDDVDPTIFERAISRIQGLGRLLVLEKIRNGIARENYVDARRALRGRPDAQRNWRRQARKHKGDLKTDVDFTGLEMNDYDSGALHIPYGPGWDARRIDKLVYQTVCAVFSLFNPNNKGRRLHRHPAFFGTMSECLEDCCENCPEPENEEEKQVQAKEDDTYVRGRIQFIEEDPGRQSISGSFNPIDVGEWAEQAYIGATERFFKAVASGDRQAVAALVQEDAQHLDRRDHVGRTPLQVAVLSRAVDIACDLIEAGARLTPRIADGRTALHLAAQLNLADVVRKMLERSAINAERTEASKTTAPQKAGDETRTVGSDGGDEDDDSHEEDDDDGHDESDEGWVVEGRGQPGKVVKAATDVDEAQALDNESEADILDVNAADWDFVFTPLQYAIITGSTAVVDLLIAHGADVSLVTVANGWNVQQFDHLTLTALTSNETVGCEIAPKLVAAGATSSQADENLFTVLHRLVRSGKADLVLTLLRCDPSAKAVLNTPFVDQQGNTVYPVVSAIDKGYYSVLAVLLAYKAKLVFGEDDFDHFRTIRKPQWYYTNGDYLDRARMPLEAAAQRRDDVVSLLIDAGVDINLPLAITKSYQSQYAPHHTLLDWIQSATHKARAAQGKPSEPDTEDALQEAARSLSGQSGWKGKAGKVILADMKARLPVPTASSNADKERKERAARDVQDYADMLEELLLSQGAKTGYEGKEKPSGEPQRHLWHNTVSNFPEHRRLDPQLRHLSTPAAMAARYDELYEACAMGDNDKIQQLCLPKIDSKTTEPPLQIVVQFGTNNATRASRPVACTPLSLAISGRHWDTAKLILAIASAQHVAQPSKETASDLLGSTPRITLADDNNGNDDESDEDDKPERQEKPLDFVEIAKRTSAIQSQAGPKDLMKAILHWLKDDGTVTCGTVFTRAIHDDDFEAFIRIADMCNIYPDLMENTLITVIVNDRHEMLDELIRRTGTGINVSTDADKAEGDKPGGQKKAQKTYLGLTVHGKKRTDFAQIPGMRSRTKSRARSRKPHAASANACCVLRYLNGDRPLAAYRYYASTHSDERAQYLRRTADLPVVLPDWLGWTSNPFNESAVTAAVMSGELDAVQKLLELRPTEMTEALNAKIIFSGFNHVLAAANWAATPELFDFLVNKGIPVTDIDHRGWNIFHLLAVHARQSHLKLMKHALGTLPQDVVEKMLMQQSRNRQYTPLALAVKRDQIDAVRILVGAKASPYLLRDVYGMIPLHVAIKGGRPKLTQLLIDAGPVEALYTEDSVGSTPLELAEVRGLRVVTHEGFPFRVAIPGACDFDAHQQLMRPTFNLAIQEREVARLRTIVDELLKESHLTAGTKLAIELQAFADRMGAKLAKARTEEDVQQEVENAQKAVEGETSPDKRTSEVENVPNNLETLEVVRRAIVARAAVQPRLLVHVLDVHNSVKKSLEVSAKPT